ncbi:MAG: methylmalonyl-CoA mutase, partial [Thermoplasmata archaeon]|nr:methylmalonyl-CoA mutase [Thermoplasmata archaeon]
KGFFQMEIADASYRYQKEIEDKQRTIVGVNDYVTDEPMKIGLLELDPEGESVQINRLEKLRKDRDQKKWEESLDRVRKVAENEEENTMPAIMEAVHAYATLGEISGVFREVFGEYKDPAIF